MDASIIKHLQVEPINFYKVKGMVTFNWTSVENPFSPSVQKTFVLHNLDEDRKAGTTMALFYIEEGIGRARKLEVVGSPADSGPGDIATGSLWGDLVQTMQVAKSFLKNLWPENDFFLKKK